MSIVALHHEISGPGDAPTLLLGGSLGTTLAMWEPQVEALSDWLKLVTFDHRGHGGSPVPEGPYRIAEMGQDVIALMDELDLNRVSYCGVSIGGMVGQWVAGNHPERIENLILIATSAYLGAPDPWLERAATVRRAGSVGVIADAVVARWFTPGWAAEHEDIVKAHRAMLARTPVEGYASSCEALAQLDVRDELSRITASTLVISGADDTAIPPAHQQAIAAAVKGAHLQTIPDAAHIPSVQHAARVNELILEYIDL